jgi:anti-sigma B factor antagonist
LLAEDSISTSVVKHGEVTVLSVGGEIDLVTCAAFEAAILNVVADKPSAIVLDLSEISFFSSAGISALIEAHEQVGSERQFAVVAAGPITGRILEILELKNLFDIHETLEAALAAVQAGEGRP